MDGIPQVALMELLPRLTSADAALFLLEARAVYDAANQTLLRATSAPLIDGEHLLRSVTTPTDTDSNQLLRSQNANDVPAVSETLAL